MTRPLRRLFDDTDPETLDNLSALDEGDQWEAADVNAVSRGDLVLVHSDEPVRVDGLVVCVEPESASEVNSVESPVNGIVTLESDDGDRRDATIDEPVERTDVVRGGSAIVRVGTDRWFPLLPAVTIGTLLTRLSASRLLVVFLMLLIALSGTGLGQFNPVSEFTRDNSDVVKEIVDSGGRIQDQRPVPNPDPITVTPPPQPEEPPDDEGDPEQPLETSTPPSESAPTTTSTAAPTTTRATTRTVTRSPTRKSPDSGTGGGGAIVTSDLSIRAGDPGNVRTTDGRVGTLRGSVDGTLTWSGEVTAVVFVVQTYVPGEGWAEVQRITYRGEKPVDLGETIGSIVYASEARSGSFRNGQNGTTIRRSGTVSVTAVLFRSQQEVGRVTAQDDYTFRVTNIPPLELELGAGNESIEMFDFGDTGDGTTGSDSDMVKPGMNGQTRVPLTNQGSLSGTLTLSRVSYESFENGQTAPESEVDTSGGDPGAGAGELDESLAIRADVEYPNGTHRNVIGDERTYRPLTALETATIQLGYLDPGESLTLIVYYEVPTSIGNEIQSDTLIVDFSFTLTER